MFSDLREESAFSGKTQRRVPFLTRSSTTAEWYSVDSQSDSTEFSFRLLGTIELVRKPELAPASAPPPA